MSTSNINLKMAQRFQEWLTAQRYAASTTARYSQVAHLFCAYVGSCKSLRDVRPMDVSDFLIETTPPGCSGLISDRLIALRCFFDFLYFGGAIDSVPPRFIHARRRRRVLPRILSQSEVAKLLEAADLLRDRAVIQMLYSTGCRSCELRTMRIDDIDFAKRKALVRGKGKERIVYFGSEAARMLRSYLGQRTSGYVFQNAYPTQNGWISCSKAGWYGNYKDYSAATPMLRHEYLGRPHTVSRSQAETRFRTLLSGKSLNRMNRDRPLYKSTLARIVSLAAAKAHLIHVTPRLLRHCFATHLLERGASVLEVQQLLGHAHLSSTEVYVRISNAQLAKVYRRCHPCGG